MNALCGKSIYIGKEPAGNGLCVGVATAGGVVVRPVPAAGVIPTSVSRCFPERSVAHCRLDIDYSGRMVLTNLKPMNVTYVDGQPIASKTVSDSSAVHLGAGYTPISLQSIIAVSRQIVQQAPEPPAARVQTPRQQVPSPSPVQMGAAAPQQPRVYSLRGLEPIWRNYEQQLERLASQKRVMGIMRSFSIGGVGMTVVAQIIKMPEQLRLALSALFIAIAMVGIVMMILDRSHVRKKEIVEDFENRYVCPNPQCRVFLGNVKYRLLIQKKSCTSCKCRYTP